MSPGHSPTYDIGEPQQVQLPTGPTTVWDSAFDTAQPASDDLPVLLLHGWNIDAPTNYGFAFPKLKASQRAVMFDHQGHGRGLRSDRPFTLADSAEDAVAVLDALEIDSAIVVGYSLGGAVAQTLLDKHPERVAGLVLSATSGRFAETRRETAEFQFLAAAAKALRKVPAAARKGIFSVILAATTRKYPPWIADVVARADPISLLEAGASLGTFDANLLGKPSPVPSAFVVTAEDIVVPPRRQVELATSLDVDSMHSLAAGHDVPILDNDDFNEALAQAVRTVTTAAQVT